MVWKTKALISNQNNQHWDSRLWTMKLGRKCFNSKRARVPSSVLNRNPSCFIKFNLSQCFLLLHWENKPNSKSKLCHHIIRNKCWGHLTSLSVFDSSKSARVILSDFGSDRPAFLFQAAPSNLCDPELVTKPVSTSVSYTKMQSQTCTTGPQIKWDHVSKMLSLALDT